MKVVIFNRAFFYISETFIYQQVKGMPPDIDISLVGFEIVNEDAFPLNNKKYRIKRSANFFDRAFSSISKRIFRSPAGIGFFSSGEVKTLLQKINPDAIHAHFGFNALTIYPIAKALNIPMVVTFHGVDASPEYLKNETYRHRIRELTDYAKGIIIVSPHMIETLQLSEHKNKTHLIPCGVNPDEFQREPRHENADVVNILHSGRLVAKKGVPDLVRVFIMLHQKHPNIRLHIIGDGPELALCRQLAQTLAGDNVVFYGSQSHQKVKEIMSDSDIFVLNSRTSDTGDMEGVPVSILEAMSMQLPVLSTRHAGIPYVITDQQDGLLVDEKDNAQLINALERLIVDSSLRRRLGKESRLTVSERFTAEQVNRRIAEVYRQLG